MIKKTQTEKKNSLHLGLYFGLVVAFIIFVSVIFKFFDTYKNSEFDGKNFFTVALFNNKNTYLISVSPKENLLKSLVLKDVKNKETLKETGIPYDDQIELQEAVEINPKSIFTKSLLQKNNSKTDLTIFDLIRLTIFTQRLNNENIQQESTSTDDVLFPQLASKWFIDPEITKENISIEITNTTKISGLGNKIAKGITNMGGNVVLVNSSQNPEKESVIFYEEDSYTLNKLSKFLGITKKYKEMNSISDIIIIIGEDNKEYL